MRHFLVSLYIALAGALVLVPNLAVAGTYSTSFPATFCQLKSGATNPTLVDASGLNNPNKTSWSFAQSATYVTPDSTIWCEVQFPRSVITANFTVNLTWQTTSSTITDNVCWQAAYEVTRVGQSWGLNLATVPAISAATVTAVTASASTDIKSAIAVIATDQTGTTCPTGTATGTCAGSHAVIQIRRSPSNACANDSASAAILTRVEFTGTIQ